MQDWFYERGVTLVPRKPYPNVEGIKKTMELYDSHEMRKHKPEDFYDDSFVRELDQSGYIDSRYR
jgi:ribosomal protein S19E (S16A)